MRLPSWPYIWAVSCLGLSLMTGCTRVYWQRQTDFSTRRITLYAANGAVIRWWNTTGKVYSEGHSDGWYFTDAADGKTKMVSGTVVVE